MNKLQTTGAILGLSAGAGLGFFGLQEFGDPKAAEVNADADKCAEHLGETETRVFVAPTDCLPYRATGKVVSQYVLKSELSDQPHTEDILPPKKEFLISEYKSPEYDKYIRKAHIHNSVLLAGVFALAGSGLYVLFREWEIREESKIGIEEIEKHLQSL